MLKFIINCVSMKVRKRIVQRVARATPDWKKKKRSHIVASEPFPHAARHCPRCAPGVCRRLLPGVASPLQEGFLACCVQ
jgi:hypothetical protein